MHRTVATILALLLLAGFVAACSDVPLDNDTANVTRRERDTVFLRDTIIARDTVSVHDTIVSKPDTVLIRKDTTIIKRDTVVETRHDTIEVVRRVTIVITKRDTVHNGDTLFVHDTLRRVDTLRIRDTVEHRDTIEVLDTVLLERHGLRMTGRLFVFHDAGPTDVIDVSVDSIASVLAVFFTGGQPTAIDLRLFARVPERPLAPPFETPSWCHINVLGITTANTPTLLRNDPVKFADRNGAGVIFRSTESDQPKWYPTSTRNEGSFSVTGVNIATRTITAMMKGRFYTLGAPIGNPPTVRIDSLALTLGY